MSGKAFGWARERIRDVAAPTAKTVLLLMADYADREHALWPSVSTLAGELGVPDRTVQRAIRDLEAAALVRVVTRSTSSGKNASNRYVLAVGEAGFGGGMGDMVSPMEGDTAPPSGVTPCHPMGDTVSPSTTLEPRTLTSESSDELSDVCVARDARDAAFGKLVEAWAGKVAGRVDRPKASEAFKAACDGGMDPAAILEMALRFLADSREANAGRLVMLDRWLSGQRWIGYEPKPAVAAAPVRFVGPDAVIAALREGRHHDWPLYLANARWDEADRAIVTSGFSAERMRRDRDLVAALDRLNIQIIVRKPG